MKKINSITFSKLAAGVLLAVGAVFVTGCSKDAKEDVALPGEGTRVVISVGGISEVGSSSHNKVKAAAGSTANRASNAALIEGDGFDVLVTRPASSSSNLSFKDKVRSAATSAEGLKAETPMTNGTAYRVFIRKEGTTTLTSLALTSGTAGSLPVDEDSNYEWFALSYNNTTAVPDAAGDDVVLDGIEGLLYAKGEFSVGSGSDVVVPLAIVFKPRVTKAVIEINTMGMFAPVAGANVNVSGLYAAPEAINVVTGELIGTEKSLDIDYDDFGDVADFQGFRKSVIAYIGGNAGEDITVSVTDLSITLDNGDPRNFGAAELTQTFSPEAGMEQNIVLNFLETPLTRSNVGWARSNLYYSEGFSPYRFYHTNPRTDDENSYFSFKGHLPRVLASSNAAQQKDPCALVFPAGRWKTPTSAELGTLTSTQGLLTNVVGGLLATLGLGATPGVGYQSGEYIEMTPNYSSAVTTGQNSAYGNNTSSTNTLRFNYNGLVADLDVAELVALNLGNTYGAQAAFWTSETINNANLGGLLGGVIDAGAWSFVGRDVALLGLLGRRGYATQSAGVTNIDLLGAVNVLSSSLMNVRCTRNSTWSPTEGYNPYPSL